MIYISNDFPCSVMSCHEVGPQGATHNPCVPYLVCISTSFNFSLYIKPAGRSKYISRTS